jgi:hypothetical protein
MEIEFRTKNARQLEAAGYWIDDQVEQILYGGAKGGGKSFLGASLIFGDALIYPETHYFIARKELNDLRKFTAPTVHEVIRSFGIRFEDYLSFNGQDNVFTLYNGSKVFLIACKENPSDPMFERFGSMQMTRGWEEEAGEIAEAAHRNLWLSVGRWKNEEYGLKKKLLITANPKKGWMKREFVDPAQEQRLPKSLRYVQAFATDNPYLPKDYIESLRSERDTVRRQRLWEGRWDYDEDGDALVSFDALTDAFSNAIVKDENKYLVVDVARLGRDTTVFNFFEGLQSYKRERFEKQSTATTIQKVKDYAAAERIPYSHILIDEDGIGGGVVDHLVGVKGFTANSTPIPTAAQIRERQAKVEHFLVPKITYANLKAQCGWKLAEIINEHRLAIEGDDDRDLIIEELSALLRDHEPDGEGRKRLKPKDEVKQELGRSPDIGDTFVMRAYFELAKEATGQDDLARARATERQNARMNRNQERSVHSTR